MTNNTNEGLIAAKSRGRKKTASASVVLDNTKSNDDFSIEKVSKNKVEKINLSDLYTYFNFAKDMCNLVSKEITIAMDNTYKEKLKEKYFLFLKYHDILKNELLKRMENVIND